MALDSNYFKIHALEGAAFGVARSALIMTDFTPVTCMTSAQDCIVTQASTGLGLSFAPRGSGIMKNGVLALYVTVAGNQDMELPIGQEIAVACLFPSLNNAEGPALQVYGDNLRIKGNMILRNLNQVDQRSQQTNPPHGHESGAPSDRISDTQLMQMRDLGLIPPPPWVIS